MSTRAMQLDLRAAARRTRYTMSTSVGAHVLLLVLLLLMRHDQATGGGGLVEVGWLEPQPAMAAGSPRAEVRSAVPSPGVRVAVRAAQQFQREEAASDVAPSVQDARASVPGVPVPPGMMPTPPPTPAPAACR